MTLTVITLNEPNLTDFAEARNQALAKAEGDWILFLDSDETISQALQAEINRAIASNKFEAYYLKRQDTFLGKVLKHGETSSAKYIRLAKKDFGHWARPVHEIWVGDGRVGALKHPLLHTPHTSITTFLAKIDRYSTLEAEYRFSQGIKSNLLKVWLYPLAKFKLNYLFRLGFLDGLPGAIMALMMSFHSYLTWTKLYLLWHKK